jgi:hypothetical protein
MTLNKNNEYNDTEYNNNYQNDIHTEWNREE